MDNQLLTEIWEALKQKCCKNPDKAKQIIFLSQKKFRYALSNFSLVDTMTCPVDQKLQEIIARWSRTDLPEMLFTGHVKGDIDYLLQKLGVQNDNR